MYTENIFNVVVFIKHFHFRTWLIFICKQFKKLLLKTGFLLFLWQISVAPLSSHFPVHRLFGLLALASVVLFLVAASSPCPEVKKVHVHRVRPPAGDPIGIIQTLWKGLFRLQLRGGRLASGVPAMYR